MKPTAHRDESLTSSAPGTIATLFAVAVIACFRRPDALLNPQFWAEDGTVFFAGDREQGLRAIFTPYAGYLHLVPRLVALIGGWVDVGWVPAFYAYASLALLLFVAWFCLTARIEVPYKPLLALALVLVPHGGESLLNLVNVQSVLAPLLVLLALQARPRTARAAVFDLALLLLVGLTGPYVLILGPVFGIRLLKGSRYDWILAAVAVLVAGIQLAVLIEVESAPPPATRELAIWSLAVGRNFLGSLFLGAFIPRLAGTHVWIVGWALVLFVSLGFLWRSKALRRPGFIVLACAGLSWGAALYRHRYDPAMLHPFGNGQRYFQTPYVMMAWFFVLMLGDSGWLRRAARVALFLILCSCATGFVWPPLEDFHWKSYADRIRKGETVSVPINPAGWTIQVGPRQ